MMLARTLEKNTKATANLSYTNPLFTESVACMLGKIQKVQYEWRKHNVDEL
jgi:hypothetical protein